MKVQLAITWTVVILAAAGVIIVAAQAGQPSSVTQTEKPVAATTIALPAATSVKPAPMFQPPSEQDMPKDEFGKTVQLGKDIFEHTSSYASQYTGPTNLRCASCHLDAGRLAKTPSGYLSRLLRSPSRFMCCRYGLNYLSTATFFRC
jgi:thiosulfate dehydrogenase